MKLKLNNIFFELFLIAPVLYTFLSVINGSYAVKFIFYFTIISFIYLFFKILLKSKKKMVIVLALFSLYVFYIITLRGIGSVLNLYFYSYIFLFSVELFCIDENFRQNFTMYFNNNSKRFLIYAYIIFILILYSILYKNGYRKDSSGAFFLYGPFSLPHTLAYIMLVLYCGISLYDKENKKMIAIIAKFFAVVCIMLSAVRSATIGLIILMFIDLFSMKSKSKKSIIIFIAIIGFIYVYTQTDMIKNSPLMIKTQYASNVGGSASSGREIYREIALKAYMNDSNVLHRFLGVGIEGVTNYIYEAIHVRIQAHNDYVNTLVGYGILGLFIFVLLQIKVCKNFKSNNNGLIFFIFIFLLGFYNGFVFYVMLTSSLPVIVVFFEQKEILKNNLKAKLKEC